LLQLHGSSHHYFSKNFGLSIQEFDLKNDVYHHIIPTSTYVVVLFYVLPIVLGKQA
jgi:hypothetical protein